MSLNVYYGKSVHGKDEIKAVLEVLKTSTQMGKNVKKFESKINNLFNKKYGLMVNSGSSALLLAFEALQLPKNAEVITPVLTFSTSISYIIKNNLIPVFVDVNRETYCIDEDQIKNALSKKTVAIVIPNLLGNLPNLIAIKKIIKKFNKKIFIIEDSADCLGSKFNKKSTGHYSDISITSFYGSHIINCAGNGGWVGFNDEKIARKARLLRSWGRTSSIFSDIQESESLKNRFNIDLGGISYDAKFVFEFPGYQMEPSEMGAAFGLVQLSNFENVKHKRVMAYKKMEEIFNEFKDFIRLAIPNPHADVIWMHFPFTIREDAPFSRKELQTFFELRGIQTRPPFSGNILRQPMIKNQRFLSPDTYENADDLMKNGVLLGCHQGLSEEQFDHVQDVSHDFFNQF